MSGAESFRRAGHAARSARNQSVAELKNGDATFNDVFFVAPGPDALLAFEGNLIGTDVMTVYGPNGSF
jgi:hypothetical protein